MMPALHSHSKLDLKREEIEKEVEGRSTKKGESYKRKSERGCVNGHQPWTNKENHHEYMRIASNM